MKKKIIKMENGEYLIYFEDPKVGGPIITGKNLQEAESKFNEAFNLCKAVSNLIHYNEYGCFKF